MHRTHLLAAFLLVTGAEVQQPALAALPPDVFSTRMTFSTYVKEDWLPGPTLYEHTDVIYDVPVEASPPQRLDQLHIARGINWSGHSTQIGQAFASATAQSDGAGGVGATQTTFSSPDAPYQTSVYHLAAQSLWTQTFTNNGTLSFDLSLHLNIPELTVGLIGVAPFRSFTSATETARSSARVDTVITRANGSIVSGSSFEFGLLMHEEQVLLGPGTYSNFFVVDPLFVNLPGGLPPQLNCNQSTYDPRCGFDPLSFDVTLGRLNPGDTIAYVYTLTVSGTTEGGERGFMAFLGDPFTVNFSGGGLTPSAIPAVPEPTTAALWLLGLGAWQLKRGRGRLARSRA